MKRTINALCAVALMAVAALMASCSGKPAAGDESGVTVINGHRFVDCGCRAECCGQRQTWVRTR